MGERKTRLRRLVAEHPFCCFCGGTRSTETLEHAPPKAFFRDKLRLKGLEFPACKRCNHGSSHLDQVASLITIAMGNTISSHGDEYFRKLADGVKNNNPEVLAYMTDDVEAVLLNSRGLLRQNMKIKADRRLIDDWLLPWGAKQAFALYYEHAGHPIGTDKLVWVNWVLNGQLLEGYDYKSLFKIGKQAGLLKQGKLHSEEQFFYRYSISDDANVAYFAIGAHNSSICNMAVFSENQLPNLSLAEKIGALFQTSEPNGIHRYHPSRTAFDGTRA